MLVLADTDMGRSPVDIDLNHGAQSVEEGDHHVDQGLVFGALDLPKHAILGVGAVGVEVEVCEGVVGVVLEVANSAAMPMAHSSPRLLVPWPRAAYASIPTEAPGPLL